MKGLFVQSVTGTFREAVIFFSLNLESVGLDVDTDEVYAKRNFAFNHHRGIFNVIGSMCDKC